jgi:putative flippase GtrA
VKFRPPAAWNARDSRAQDNTAAGRLQLGVLRWGLNDGARALEVLAPSEMSTSSVREEEGWGPRLWRFVRSLVVGGGGAVADFASLTFCLRVLELSANTSRLVGLVLGAFVLFFGSRSFVFRAESGNAKRQALLFVIFELLGLPINLAAFAATVELITFVPPEIVSLLANFIVFVTYHYPVRAGVVFRVSRRAARGSQSCSDA